MILSKLIKSKKIDKNNLINIFYFFFISTFVLFFALDDQVGTISLLILISLTFILIKFYTELSHMLMTALFLRIFIIYIGKTFDLPDSLNDAVVFEKIAFDWSQNGILAAYDHSIFSTFFLSWLIGIFYSLFDRSVLMAQSLSLFFGMGSIFLGWFFAKKLWGERIATKVGWLLTLFPSLILYSTLILREAYIIFFLLVAFFGLFKWTREKSFKWIIISTLGFISSTLFHGALLIGAIIFLSFVGLYNLKILIKSLKFYRISLQSITIAVAAFIILILFFSSKIAVPKLSKFSEATKLSKIISTTSDKSIGDAAFPNWLKINSTFEIFYKSPIRAIYFLFSPFPWQVSKLSHLIGLLDGLLYLLLFYYIFCNRKVLMKDPALKITAFILACYFFMFGIGVGNFGTSIRHRVKFVILLILLAAPYIPKIILSKKIKSSKS